MNSFSTDIALYYSKGQSFHPLLCSLFRIHLWQNLRLWTLV